MIEELVGEIRDTAHLESRASPSEPGRRVVSRLAPEPPDRVCAAVLTMLDGAWAGKVQTAVVDDAARDDARVWTVPNAISFLRLLGVPLFLWLVLGPEADGWALGGARRLRRHRLPRRLPRPAPAARPRGSARSSTPSPTGSTSWPW